MDARLAVAAAGAWVAVLVGSHTTPGLVLAVSLAALALGLTILIAGRRWADTAPGVLPRIAAGLALILFCSAGVLFPLAARIHGNQVEPVRTLSRNGASALLWATTKTQPRLLKGGFVGAPRVAVDATLTGLRSGPTIYHLHAPVVILAPAGSWSEVSPGQAVRLDGRLRRPERGEQVASVITVRGAPTTLGSPPWWQRWALEIRRSLQRACAGLPAAERGLLPGLVDGDVSGLDPGLAQDFRTAGLTHLTAVSGTNAAILIGAVLLTARRLRAPPLLAATLGAMTVAAFVVVAGPSPSVLRAAVMASVLLLALAGGRPRRGLPALSAAVLLLLAWYPQWSADAGFAMSVLATGALMVIAPGWAAALRRGHVPVGIAEGLAVAAAASAVSAPIVVLLSGRISLVALPANLLAEVVVAPVTVLGVLAAVTAPVSIGVGAVFAQAAGWPCRWLVAVGTFFGSLPGASVEWPQSITGALLLAALTLAVVVLARYRPTRIPLVAAAVVALTVQIPVRAWTDPWPPTAIFVACDVGQGDGVVLPVGRHAAVVMDSGPEPLAIDRCLTSLGITRVPVYIQSHFDLDHVGGFAGVVDGRQIGQVFTGPLQQPALGRSILHSALDPLGITPAVIAVGASIQIGPLRLDVLASHIVFVSGQPDSNNSSLVLRATVAGRRILLTGDAAEQAQQDLLADGTDVTADVLKVPHHGSSYFDPEFMAAVHPELAVISVGAGNPYGHPSLRLLDTMADLGVPVRRTDEDGDVAVLATAAGLRVMTHHPSARLVNAAGRAPDLRPGTAGAAVTADLGSDPAAKAIGRVRIGPWPTVGIPKLLLISSPASSSSSAMRSSSSAAPSSRSPPPTAIAVRARTSSREPAPNSSPASSMSC